MFGYQLVSECFGQTAKLGLAAGVGADIPAACKVRRVVHLVKKISKSCTHLHTTRKQRVSQRPTLHIHRTVSHSPAPKNTSHAHHTDTDCTHECRPGWRQLAWM